MMLKRIFVCFFTITVFCIGAFSVPSLAAYRGESPEKMSKLASFQILGVTIDMTIGEIMQKFEGQGHKFVCRFTACQFRTDGYEFTIVHTKKSLGNRGPQTDFDRNATPISIGIGNVTDFSVCAPAREMIKKFCNHDDQKQPCWTSNFGVTNGNISSRAKSADGFRYNARVMLNPNKTCSVGVKRQ